MKSLAHQSEAELGGSWSVLARQRRDNATLDLLLDEVLAASGAGRDAALRAAARIVVPHAFAEQAVLWPEVRRCLPEGKHLTALAHLRHLEIAALWSHLESDGVPEPERQRIAERLVAVLREGIREEEDVLLPRLQESVDARRLRRLGIAWEAVRRAAPTRPYPEPSKGPAGRSLAVLPLAALGRGRDRLADSLASVGRLVPSGRALTGGAHA